METKQERVLSGMRPSGRLHLGNFFGALKNWVDLQGDYRCFFFIADLHALTTDYDDTSQLQPLIVEMAVDWMASGLDPESSAIFVQSQVPEHAELHLLLSMITPLAWLERVPSYKEQQQELSNVDLGTYGFLGYPLLQTADIIIYKANWVPVGVDQVAHIELAREVVRRFHYITKAQVFPEPLPKLTEVLKLPGTDGRKMSKSYNNAIYLSDEGEPLKQKLMTMVTDPARKRRSDPGNPDVCPVYDLHKIFSSVEELKWSAEGCRTAGIGCIDCKKVLHKNMAAYLEPIQERRREILSDTNAVKDILMEGSRKARAEAQKTLDEAKAAMHL
ncbi:MAG: tryptophan--tRNA ligase [Nitrospinota bacterium]